MVINKVIVFPEPGIKLETAQKAERSRLNDKSGFAVELDEALNQTAVTGRVISLENQRALNTPQGMELTEAGNLLQSLTSAVAASPKSVLENIHRLEGLVQYYRV